ncbi:MAG: O-acetyl-ADP-ribose deacetylase [candidate division WS6 bacterium OLB20]|uniref:O-acetyl-ADP-ribose deacetylase n=1 Tax=candidate division WS6 bacterium OLB20 TaxID=1617426 RepID=A0A136M114_9BACT|nr:MAG: O-acetyl-ADP-ribose deacetylase [candidate division WS6 bacterium OLB20]
MAHAKYIVADLLSVDADVLVNSANRSLLAGSGVCGQIFTVAGKQQLEAECLRILQDRGVRFLGDGTSVMTGAYNLPFQAIIHSITPKNHVGDITKVYDCYHSAMQLAIANGYQSIVFPLLGTGVNNIPAEYSGEQAIRAVDAVGDILTVYFCSRDASLVELFRG